MLLTERAKKSRPYLQVSFELLRSSLTCLVFRNVGEIPLEVISISFDKNFITQLSESKRKMLVILEKTNMHIFPTRYYVISLDVTTSKIVNEFKTSKLVINFEYKKIGCSQKTYKEKIEIDFKNYSGLLLYISETDELKNSVDKLGSQLDSVKEILIRKLGDDFKERISGK